MSTEKLERKLGLLPVLSMSIGTTIGSGIFVTVSVVASAAGSPTTAIWSWFLGGLAVLPTLFVMAELATAYPENGSGYVYLKKAGLEPLAFLYGWGSFWATDPPSISILALAMVNYMAFFIPALTGLAAKFTAVGIIILLTAIHYRSVKGGGMLQVVLTAAKIIPFAILIGLGLSHLNLVNYSAPANPNIMLFAGIWAGVSATTWAYNGMASVCYMTGEVKDPGKTMPKAMIGSAILITSIYTLIAFTINGLLPFDELLKSTAPLADAAKNIPVFSDIAASFIAATAVIVIFGSLSPCIMAQGRLEYAMAKDNLFFKSFGHIHPKHGTPDVSMIVQSIYAIILIFLSNITSLLGIFSFVLLVLGVIQFSTIFICRRKDPNYNPTFKCPAWPVMGTIAVAATAWLAWGTFMWSPKDGLIGGVIVVATGLPAYYYWRKQRKDSINDTVAQ